MLNKLFGSFTARLSFLLFLTASCQQMNKLITIENQIYLPEVSSGSGLAIVDDKIYIVGDDSPFLYELNMEWAVIHKHLLLEGLPVTERIPKAIKPDFECMAEEKTAQGTRMWMFGSGSKSPERDLLVIYDPAEPGGLRHYSLTALYDKLMAFWGIGQDQLNLEAAVILDQKLYLFNRGSNQLAILPLAPLKSYLAAPSGRALDHLEIETLYLELAKAGELQSRFSGACTLPGTSLILFSATLEDTENWIDDGEIRGSMLGFFDTQQPELFSSQKMAFVTTADGAPALEKIESIGFLEQEAEGHVRLLAVSDNDDGSSALFSLLLNRNFLLNVQ